MRLREMIQSEMKLREMIQTRSEYIREVSFSHFDRGASKASSVIRRVRCHRAAPLTFSSFCMIGSCCLKLAVSESSEPIQSLSNRLACRGVMSLRSMSTPDAAAIAAMGVVHQPVHRKITEMFPIELAVPLREAIWPKFHEAGRDQPRQSFPEILVRGVLPGLSERVATSDLGFESADFPEELLHVCVCPHRNFSLQG